MRFVFIIPDSPFLIDEKVFPFLGPLYLSAVLKKEGHEVEVVDLAGGREIPQLEADYIGITATTPQFPRAVQVADILKMRNPEQKVIIGGPHASANPDECRKYFDLVCIGEGERFIQAAASHNNFHVESFPYIDDLDDIPFPDWDAIDLSQYHYFIDSKRTMNILTSRGCPYACSFCLPKGSLVLTKNLEWVPIEALKIGDKLIGTRKRGRTKFQETIVTETFHRESSLLEIETTHGIVKCSPEHPWLTTHNRWRRAEQLKVGQCLRWVSSPKETWLDDSISYMQGYIAGVIEGDGCLHRYPFKQNGKEYVRHCFRLVGDDEMDDTFLDFCHQLEIDVYEQTYTPGKLYKVGRSIETWKRSEFEKLEAIVNMNTNNTEFKRGFLAGIYDAEGSWSSAPRFHNRDEELKKRIEGYLHEFSFKTVRDVTKADRCGAVRVTGGNADYIRLMSLIRPRVSHKRNIMGKQIHCQARIVSSSELPEKVEVFNIETTTNDFIAEGFVSHNCCKAPWGQKIRFRSAENVIEEIGLLRIRGYEGLMLYDDEFFLNEKRDLQIALALDAAGMVWRCFSRADVIMRHTDLIKAAAASGLREVLIGCESGSNIILDNIHKGTKTWMNEEAICFLKSLGVRVKAALIVGLPGETPDTIKSMERFVERVKPDSVDFTVLRVMPGSDIWRHPENYDLKFLPDYKPYKTIPGQYETGVSTSAMTAKEIVEARDYLDRKFNPQLWR